MPKPQHILVIRFSAMGDVAMAVPVLLALQQQHPQVNVTVLTKPFFKPIFSGLKNTTVITANLKAGHKGILGLYTLAHSLKSLKVDAIADIHNVLRTKILKLVLHKYPFVQINKGRNQKKALVKGKLNIALKTTHQRYADVFKALGYPLDLTKVTFPPKNPLSTTLASRISPKTPNIGIAPFAAHKGKMYPLHLMEQVIQQLATSYNVLLFGSTTEAEILENFAKTSNNITTLAGKYTFGQELQIIQHLDVMLAMDSGNAHLAAMQGVKVVTIWGVTHPNAGFSPFNQPSDYALLANQKQFPQIPTSIYGNSYPDHYETAAGSIPVTDVVQKIKSIL